MPPPGAASDASEGGASSSQHHAVEEHVLPALAETPTAYAGCCLALSVPLVTHIRSLLPPQPALTLSIGSGFGLLEAHLLAPRPSLRIIGVEVAPSPNQYLPLPSHHTVHGSRFLEPLAGEATTWLFVYPRRVALVSEYMSNYGNGSVGQIIWIGPHADWAEYMACFTGWHVHTQSAHDVGGRAWDVIAVAKRTL
jgi:hypothetical protein